MIQNKETYKTLNSFAKRVISRARANLTRGDINVSKELYNSLDYDLKVSKNSLSLKMIMSEYGAFRDLGVKGKNPSLVKNGVQKAPNSPFKFRDKKPKVDFIVEWAKARRIRLRDDKGKFAKGSYLTIGFILQNRIYAQGIKPSLFFTNPYKSAFKDLPDDLIEAYGLDLRGFLGDTFKGEDI